MEKYLVAGRIVNTHGIKGEVKIQPYTDDAEFLAKLKRLYMDEKPFRLLSSKVHKGCLIAELEGVSSVNDAMVLKNKLVYFDRGDVRLSRGEFFLQDIMGAAVVDESGTELGKLTDVLDLPSSRVYVVSGQREILIPVVPDFVLKTDVEACTITVRLIEGM